MTDKVKQIIVIRRDLRNSDGQKVSTGKLIVQGAHASIAFLTDKIRQHISRQDSGFPDMSINNVDVFSTLTDAEKEWVYGTFFKVCVGVDSEKELLDIGYNAVMLGLSVKYIEETTGFDKPTVTCLAIGPDYSSKIDPVTKHLKLL